MKKDTSTTITQHVNEFTSKAGQLEEAGIDIPDELLSIMLLNSLPEEYESFSIAMESRDDIPTLEILKAKLKEEEARQIDRTTDDKKSDALLARGSHNRRKQPHTTQKIETRRQTSINLMESASTAAKLGTKVVIAAQD